MAPRDAVVAVEAEPYHHVTTKRLGEGHAFTSPATGFDACPELATWQPLENLIDQQMALLDLADADPYPRIDVTRLEHRHFERQLGIGRVVQVAARVEGAAGSAA